MNYKLVTINMLSCLLLVACSNKKKTNISLAKNYYQQSLVEAEKNKRKALVLVDKSIENSPTPKAYALKATLLYQINKYKESLKLFEKIVNNKKASNTLKADISNNLACNYLVLGKKEKARAIWEKLTTNRFYVSPEVAWFNLGLLDLSKAQSSKKINAKEKKQLKQAVMFFKKSIEINLDYIDAYFYLSVALTKLKMYHDAKQYLVQVIGIMPNHQPAKDLIKQIDMLKQQQSKH